MSVLFQNDNSVVTECIDCRAGYLISSEWPLSVELHLKPLPHAQNHQVAKMICIVDKGKGEYNNKWQNYEKQLRHFCNFFERIVCILNIS